MGVKSYILGDGEFLQKKFINKFLPLERALNLLNSNTIWFSNPIEWPDPYESRFITAKYDGKSKFAWKDRVFCSCFTDNAASEASWTAYSRNSICIKLTFYRNELNNVLEHYLSDNPHSQVYLDKVQYLKTKDIEKPLSKIELTPPLSEGATIRSMEFKERLLMLKRKAFEYEEEYRAIIVKPKAMKAKGINVKFNDLHALIPNITIGPTVGDDTFLALQNMFINNFGYDKKSICQSRLYTKLPEEINIRTK